MPGTNIDPAKEFATIIAIGKRAARELPGPLDTLHYTMDVEAVHDVTPLRLEALLAANKFDFLHDIGGIAKNLNRETRVLENCFVPRFTV